MPPRRDFDQYQTESRSYSSMDEFLASQVDSGIHSIHFPTASIDLLVENRNAITTLVVFHAATPSPVETFPVFAGRTVTKSVDANLIFVSDPILERGVNLGWFAGLEGLPLQDILPQVLQHVLKHIPHHRYLAFFGPSGGGFAALFYGSRFKDSLVIPMNPQTDFSTYDPNAVDRYYSAAWGESERSRISISVDLVPLLEASRQWILYIHNKGDLSHARRYLLPLISSTPYRQRVGVLLGEWGKGHKPAPGRLLTHIFKEMANCNGDWNALLNTLDTDRSSTARNLEQLGHRYDERLRKGITR